ncbi:IS110 family transposase [Bradyrhizobium liaoningense]|nr:transposase [Bradyrhizobium liaoningense]MBR0716569.1 IS110 family transposase [Bradyrhizobium liaoningense]
MSCGSRLPFAGSEGPHPGVRPTHQRLASITCDEQTAGRCPRRRAGAGQALVTSVADTNAFRSGRDFAAWVGLVPKQNSSGGKDKLGSIRKQGDRYLRSLFTAGALAVIRYVKIHGTGHRPWLTGLLARRPTIAPDIRCDVTVGRANST